MGKRPALKTVLGQPSWRVATPRVEAYVTRTGGHLGPITFDRAGRRIAPMSVAPWASEKLDHSLPPILKVLRGDFFCLPFGGNETPYRGERHPVHGETANAPWKFESLEQSNGRSTLHLSLTTTIRAGRVDKFVSLASDHDAVYQRHVVSSMSGEMNLGHHAMLKFPDREGAGVVSTSPFVLGQSFYEPTERPENRGYSMLEPGATFDSLDQVPTITGRTTDLSRYPARREFEDIVQLVADDTCPFAWTAVTFPRERFVWFALKDPRVLRSTIFWISNGGRHFAPWNGRHVNVMGLEEVTSYFHGGLAESAGDNPMKRRGIATSVTLSPRRPLVVNYIFGVATIPTRFDRVASVEPNSRTKGVTLRSASGKAVRVPLDVDFLGRQAEGA